MTLAFMAPARVERLVVLSVGFTGAWGVAGCEEKGHVVCGARVMQSATLECLYMPQCVAHSA